MHQLPLCASEWEVSSVNKRRPMAESEIVDYIEERSDKKVRHSSFESGSMKGQDIQQHSVPDMVIAEKDIMVLIERKEEWEMVHWKGEKEMREEKSKEKSTEEDIAELAALRLGCLSELALGIDNVGLVSMTECTVDTLPHHTHVDQAFSRCTREGILLSSVCLSL
jgi:hypothetical protein